MDNKVFFVLGVFVILAFVLVFAVAVLCDYKFGIYEKRLQTLEKEQEKKALAKELKQVLTADLIKDCIKVRVDYGKEKENFRKN